MKKFKKILSLTLVLALCLSLAIPTFAASDNTYRVDEMKAFLISREYPSEFLETLIDPQIESLYTSVANNDSYFYGFVTGEGIIETDYAVYTGSLENEIELTVLLGIPPTVAGENSTISEVYVYVYYDWLKVPSSRGSDGITVNWDSSLFSFKSMSATDYAQSPFSGQWVTNATWNSPTRLGQGGLGYNPKIRYTDTLNGVTLGPAALRGNAEIVLVPKITMTQSNTSSTPIQSTTNINVEYGHNKTGITPSFSVSSAGLGGGVTFQTTVYFLAATYLFYYWKTNNT